MKKCPKCAHENGSRAGTCSACGAPFAQAASVRAPARPKPPKVAASEIAEIRSRPGTVLPKKFRVTGDAAGGITLMWPDDQYIELTPAEAEAVRLFYETVPA